MTEKTPPPTPEPNEAPRTSRRSSKNNQPRSITPAPMGGAPTPVPKPRSGAERSDVDELLRECNEVLDQANSESLAMARFLQRSEPLLLATMVVRRLGHVGEELNVQTTLAVLHSSMLEKPLGMEVVASLAAGKSNLVDTVLRLVPEKFIHRSTSASDKALYYMGDLLHRIVARAERDFSAESGSGSLAFRELMSNGEVSRDVTMQLSDHAPFRTQTVRTRGPIAYVETTTSPTHYEEDASRMIRVLSDETPEQTRRVHEAIAESFAGGTSRRRLQAEQWADAYRLLYTLTRAEVLAEPMLEVRVPYALKVADQFPDDLVRARRVLTQVLTIVRAVALVRFAMHDVHEDGDSRWIEADPEDWRQARRIARPVVGRALLPMDDAVEKLYVAARQESRGRPFTIRDAIEWSGVSENTARKRLTILVDLGLLDADPGSNGGRGKARHYWVASGASFSNRDIERMLPKEV